MDEESLRINRFLVHVFNLALRSEENCLTGGGYSDLTLKEMHVLEAVVQAGEENRVSQIAKALGVTAGTLTTTCNVLIKKGYLVRVVDARDRRVKRLSVTPRGKAADERHQKFHEELVQKIRQMLTPEEARVFVRGLDSISRFFKEKDEENGEEKQL